MKITILGSGCAWGTPKAGCECSTCRSGTERKRFGLLVEAEGVKLLVDASPDLRSQLLGARLGVEGIDGLLLTHPHYDHICGLGEFRGAKTEVFGLRGVLHAAFEKSGFGYLVRGGYLKLRPMTAYRAATFRGFRITPIPLDHDFPSSGFVLEKSGKKVVIANDTAPNIPEKSLALMRGADLLLIDSWAEDMAAVKKAARLLYGDDSRFRLSELRHLIIPEAKALSAMLDARKAVAVHMTHTAAPQKELERRFGDAHFGIGYDGLALKA
ncbi:Ribonuclease BN [Candidatus Norongarragalina meridionalis]|nr:Ribonuclease BN [Candidatus Norongarragalina meridionalis]